MLPEGQTNKYGTAHHLMTHQEAIDYCAGLKMSDGKPLGAHLSTDKELLFIKASMAPIAKPGGYGYDPEIFRNDWSLWSSTIVNPNSSDPCAFSTYLTHHGKDHIDYPSVISSDDGYIGRLGVRCIRNI